jgi:hypothetical protein
LKVLIAASLLTTVILLLGVKWREEDESRGREEDTLFPKGLFACQSCPYFQHAQSDPEHALSVCPVCGLTLLPKENENEPRN